MLSVHRSERSSALADGLADVLSVPLADPLAPEVVAVPAKGVERWLTQHLSTRLGGPPGARGAAGVAGVAGVAANIDFPSTHRLVAAALCAATGVAPEDDPWTEERLVWTVLRAVDDCLHEPWCEVLREHLAGEHRTGRRYATAEHLTRLLRSYGEHRPELLRAWAADDLSGVPADLHWQVRLWQQVRDQLGPSRAEQLPTACRALREDPAISDLPERVSLFGPTRLTAEQLQVLQALAHGRDVHLWLPHPSRGMHARLARRPAPATRAADESALLLEHPLLASLARDARELQHRLSAVPHEDVVHGEPAPVTSLLARLQADLREDCPPTPAPADGSVQVHACHGPTRQVEVLREVLLHVLAGDPTLEPRDVLVMCPDVEACAPLVRAAFGQGRHGAHPGHRLRVRLADRSLRSTNPLLDVVAVLLELADGRVTASQVLDLAAAAPVRRRFGFDEDDLERLRDWAGRSGVRWGIDQAQREAHGLVEVPQSTWTTGLDRVLLGVTADETDLAWLGNTLPLDDVDSSDVELAGALAELVDRLHAVLWRLRGSKPAQAWAKALGLALEWLTDVPEEDAWQPAQARRELAAATEHAGQALLRLPDVRALLADRLAGRPTRANFRTGELTVCTMVPMRSVPHRVVVLLGLDDEVFPRGAGSDGDDLLAREPRPGERDRRSEDRQLLLDAISSAGERLVVLYAGADPVTGRERPPAVPLGEVLDVLTEMTAQDLTRRHPLQPFDPSPFRAPTFSHDGGALAGAVAAQGPRTPPAGFLPAPLVPAAADDVPLEELVAFVTHPVRAFLRQRLGVHVPDEQDEVADALRAELDGLATWAVGDRWLQQVLAGTDVSAFRSAEWRRGTLPPGRLGTAVLADVERTVLAIAEVAQPFHRGARRVVDVDVELGDGRRVTGTVTGLHGDVLASTSYSQLGARHRLPAWVRLLALAAARPGPWQAVTTGKGAWRAPSAQSRLTAPPDPLAALRDLVALRDEGLRAPLPLATAAGAAYADRRASGCTVDEALEGARKEVEGMFGERHDRHLRYVHGEPLSLDVLLAEPGSGDEPHRFGVLSRRLWDPLLAHEVR